MYKGFDLVDKAFLAGALTRVGTVRDEQQVTHPEQSVDVWFMPDPARAEGCVELGWLGHMARLGPGLFEPFHNTPGELLVRSCIRKQLAVDHTQAREARQARRPRPPMPNLWVLSAGEPRTALDRYGMCPIPAWPEGFFAAAPGFALHVVVVRRLPESRDTLLLRLLGRGSVRRRALEELRTLPVDAWEHGLAESILVAFRASFEQDDTQDIEMHTYLRHLEDVYAEWHERVHKEGHADGLRRALERIYVSRFGDLPGDLRTALASQNDPGTLDRWLALFATGTVEDIRSAVP